MSLLEVATKHGLTPPYIRIVAGIEMSLPSDRVLKTIALLQGGARTAEVVDALSITPQAVNTTRRRAIAAGITFPEKA